MLLAERMNKDRQAGCLRCGRVQCPHDMTKQKGVQDKRWINREFFVLKKNESAVLGAEER
jgi:hypothetical protein